MRRLVQSLLLVCLAAPPAEAARFALLVAVEDPAEQGTPATEEVRRLGEVLENLGGLRPGRGWVLGGAGRDLMTQALRQLEAVTSQDSGDHEILVHLVGRVDARGFHLRDGVLPWAELGVALGRIRAPRMVVMVDAWSEEDVAPAPVAAVHWVPRVTRRHLVGAVFDEPGPRWTRTLQSGLRGAADADGDGQVTLAEAVRHADEQTGRTPDPGEETAARWVVTAPNEAPESHGELLFLDDGRHLVRRGYAPHGVVAEIDAYGMRRSLTLPSGTYIVTAEGAGKQPRARFDVERRRVALVAHDTLIAATLIRQEPEAYVPTPLSVLVMGGMRGALTALGLQGRVEVGARHDWVELSLEARLSYGHSSARRGPWRVAEHELGLALAIIKDFDLGYVRVGGGAEVGFAYYGQRFSDGAALDTAIGFIGAFLQGRAPIWERFFVRFDLGGVFYLLPRLRANNSVEVTLPATWRMGLGVEVHL